MSSRMLTAGLTVLLIAGLLLGGCGPGEVEPEEEDVEVEEKRGDESVILPEEMFGDLVEEEDSDETTDDDRGPPRKPIVTEDLHEEGDDNFSERRMLGVRTDSVQMCPCRFDVVDFVEDHSAVAGEGHNEDVKDG